MNKNWFWGLISFFSFALLIVFSIRIITYGNDNVPLFSEFISLYENFDGGAISNIYNDILEYVRKFLLVENSILLDTLEYRTVDFTSLNDLLDILFNFYVVLYNIFSLIYNSVISIFSTLVLGVLNAVNVLFEVCRILLVLLQFTLGVHN